jgi:hypothetical protein
MAVSIEELSCLDCTIWLKSQSKASDFLRVSQPVVSRNIKKVSDTFNISYFKDDGEYEIIHDQASTRLDVQRKMHQEMRFEDKKLILRFDAFKRMKSHLTEDVIKTPWRIGVSSDIENPTLFKNLMDSSIIDAWMSVWPETTSLNSTYTAIPVSRYVAYIGATKNHPILSLSNEISIKDTWNYPLYFGSPEDFPILFQKLESCGFKLHRGKRMNRLVYLAGLLTSKNYLFPISPGSGTQFERELVALPVKIPIEFESRLVIKTQFLNSFKLDLLLENIKTSHQNMSAKSPGWIASLL